MTTITNEEQDQITKAFEERQKNEAFRTETLLQIRKAVAELLHGIDQLCESKDEQDFVDGIPMLCASLAELALAAKGLLPEEPQGAVGQPNYARNAHVSVGGEEQ